LLNRSIIIATDARQTSRRVHSPCNRMSSRARRHGSTQTAASIDVRAFISSSEVDELSLQLLLTLQLPATENLAI